MNTTEIIKIIDEELSDAKTRIINRVIEDNGEKLKITDSDSSVYDNLPDNKNYKIALEEYMKGNTHSGTARKLGVSIAMVKKYYNWLVINGHLPTENEELSNMEQQVVDCIFVKKMSLRETANELNCSTTNVTSRRDSALRKGYIPNVE